jgi:hypothetical protein
VDPAASPQLSTEQRLLQAILPERDQRLLAIRLKNQGQEIPLTVPASETGWQLGAADTFWVTDNQEDSPQQFQTKATLQYITDHSYWWVEDGFEVNAAELQRSAERFESQTYPTNRAFFGSEWSPGVDRDARVHIFMGNVPGNVAGYFSASNSYSNQAEPFSNEREMFFINLKAVSPGNDYFDGVLAHEFQHMIHWHINGYGISNFVGAFHNSTDTQLTRWTSLSASFPNYGGSFLFMVYFLQRYGQELTQAVVANPNNGIAGFNDTLAQSGYAERFDDIFADFLLANYLNDSAAGEGLWAYDDGTVNNTVRLTERHGVYPAEIRTTVFQYGADYIELNGTGDVTIEFTGSTRVKVIPNEAHSGTYQWYSHRGDDSDMRLTRLFDLRQVSTATLKYWTWYDIEADWDFGYIEISGDGGTSWEILQTPRSSTTNPTGNAFGPGYTGVSGDGPVWVEERIDLSAYAGQQVLIRFEYVTDDAVNRPGWTIDDISIPEIDFFDDVENGANGWTAEGFVRIDNVLPQRFLVQVLEVGPEIEARTISLDETNHGFLTISGLASTVEHAVLIVSGLAPVTTEPASYEYKLTNAP